MRKTFSIIICCLLLVSMFTGCGILQKFGIGENESEELQPASSIVMGEEEARLLSDKVPIHLYFANEDGSKLKLEVRYIPVSEAKKSVNNLAGIVVNELIKGPTKKGLKATIPEGTKLVKNSVPIKDGVATVNFSKDFVDKHPGGKDAERITIYSIVNSLTDIKAIQEVKFLINGKVCETYKGNFKFDAAFPRNLSIISNEVALPSPGATENASGLSKTEPEKGNTADNETVSKDNEYKDNKDKDNTSKNNSDKDNIKKDDTSKKSDSGIDMEETDQSVTGSMSNITVDSDGTILE
ncbi:MAG TPA: GerMN domain-containing protein [Pseudobacteroides sp.]|uniref:GerMN domain-containing protein n=1 Tax=Pseudobacteroides sp. TaxID=1968840 RepID=UPI002F946D56